MNIDDEIPLVDEILDQWQPDMGKDYLAYKNHVNRVIRFCLLLHEWTEEEQQKIIITACFHDLGIWTEPSFDYLEPSIALAEAYLDQQGRGTWISEVSSMIGMHHKVTAYKNRDYRSVEIFRRADLVDVSLGTIRFGLPKAKVKAIRQQFPNAGFHKRLGQLIGSWSLRHPLRPLPMFKW